MNHKKFWLFTLAFLLLCMTVVAIGGCAADDDDDDNTELGDDDDDSSNPDPTTGPVAPPADPDIIVNPAGIAAIYTDFFSNTLVAALDLVLGAFTEENLIDGSSTGASITTTLSNDVVLSTNPNAEHEIVIIDRINSTLTLIDSDDFSVIRQIDVGEGAALNPRDTIRITAEKSYATRYDVSGENGSDIAIYNPGTGEVTGKIDLAGQTTTDTVLARPDTLIRGYGLIWVTLSEISADFFSYGSGVVVGIDPESDEVRVNVVIPGLKNCQGSAYDPVANMLYIVCSGDWDTDFSDSAIVAIDAEADPPSVVATYSADSVGGGTQKFAQFLQVVDDKLFAIMVDPGWPAAVNDRLYRIDIADDSAELLFEGTAGFVFNGVLADTENETLYLSDAGWGASALRSFDLFGAPTTEPTAIDNTAAAGLGPNMLSFY
jgi:hypothetical protein